MTTTMTPKPLRDAMYRLSLAQPVPDAELLDRIVKQHPEHADALTAFAIELAMDAKLYGEDEPDVPENPETVSPAVSRAMSNFQNQLYSAREAQKHEASPRAATATVDNPFRSFDRHGFRMLADNMDVNVVFLSKLRDRLIEPETIPHRFCDALAEKMDVSQELLAAHFHASLETAPSRQFFKAKGKPANDTRQSFEDAIRSSALSNDRQRRLLAFRD